MADTDSNLLVNNYTDVEEELLDNTVAEEDPSKFLLGLLHGHYKIDDAQDSSEGSVYSTSSSSFGGDTIDVPITMESFLRRQRKCMEICIYRQLMTKSRGSSDPVQVRRVCADLVDQAFDDVREARVMGPSSLTHRTMEGADEVSPG